MAVVCEFYKLKDSHTAAFQIARCGSGWQKDCFIRELYRITKPFTKVTSLLGSIARACRFKSCRAHQLVASVISLATSFYVSHKSSSRAHSAAPRFKIATISLGCDFVFPMAKAILSFEIVTASHGFVRERSRRKRSPLGAKKRRRKR